MAAKTFLELCQDLTRESGAIGTAPASVTGQTGRQEKCVNWVRNAWKLIQNLEDAWSFRQAQFDSELVPDTLCYTSASFNIDRFSDWKGDRNGFQPLTIYDPDIGQADESAVRQIAYNRWRTSYDRGVHDANRPQHYAFSPDGTICFGPKPDKAYVVRGEYTKSPQVLATNTEEPDMPERFHDIIVWRAIILIAEHDEAVNALQLARLNYAEMLAVMQKELLPKFGITQQPIA